MNLIAIFNRDGGTFKTTDMDEYCRRAEQVFRAEGHEIECRVVAGEDVVDAMEKVAATSGVEGLIAGGGDGTISAAGAIAWKSGLALGIVPAGTMNLFARTLKLPLDIWQVLDVLAKAEVQHADIASANGRSFVHQFSAGLHARMVRYRNQMSFASRLGKIRASTRAAFGVMLNPPAFEVEFSVDGRKELRRVSAISVSNNEFGNDGLLYADTATGGHLGFYIADALKPPGVASLAVDILRGRLKENEAVSAMTATEVDLHFPHKRRDIRCVIDGELLPMDRDVSLKIHAGELKVLVRNPQQPIAQVQAQEGMPDKPAAL
ncbi:diacylglycerol kinase family protein [Rhizobium sp. SSA_523]|uniref:diacylglycerol/lipid kinase family protein n=1 Tax=Rhizobium sp. SSA_523 TaxID=2952477 RepID=UPI0020907E0B|nr:diacylglycerol kinase family protein [Rhizobium sp. SSA_523]MCO5730867.1 diacylglycerol kinase family lipid kinase [Rhizobium sp. SSA_523]WKC24315.1 diacylglycerol kinase family lipid kinase [Rhizobium sp. SSA_523]